MRQTTISLRPSQAATSTPMISPARMLQRKCACGGPSGASGECAACASKRLSRRAAPGVQAEPQGLPPIVDDVLRTHGQPLDPQSRSFFEPRFGHDFGRVRVHADGRSGEAAQAVGARAFSVGRDLVFGHSEYAPHTPGGRRLLAHELAHVMQQRHAPDHGPITMGNQGLEQEADMMGERALAGSPPGRASSTARGLHRQQADDSEIPSPPRERQSDTPALARRESLTNAGRGGGRFDAAIDRDVCMLAANMKIRFNFVDAPSAWPSNDDKADWQEKFVKRVTKRWTGRYDLERGDAKGCPGENCERLGVVMKVEPVTSGEHFTATVGHTSSFQTSSVGATTATLDSLDVEERDDIDQVPVEHEFGHMLGLPHVHCDSNDSACYGVTDEEQDNIMGHGSTVSMRDYEVFAEAANHFSPCRWRPVETRSAALRGLVGGLIGGILGAGIGAIFGPIGALVGGLIGIAAGAIIGAATA